MVDTSTGAPAPSIDSTARSSTGALMARPISHASPSPSQNFSPVFIAAAEEATSPIDVPMSFQGGLVDPLPTSDAELTKQSSVLLIRLGTNMVKVLLAETHHHFFQA